MTDIEIIGTQAKKIFELVSEIQQYTQSIRNVTALIYGIGGPLNDNKLKFTKEQLVEFSRIVGYLGE